MDTKNLQGFHYAFIGFKSLLLPKISAYTLWPILINLVIFGLLFAFGLNYLWHKFTFFHFPSLPSWLQWLNSLLFTFKIAIITLIATFLLGIFTILATLGANLVGAPFNGLLSEALSEQITAVKIPSQSISSLMINATKRELIKFGYYLPRMIGVFILAGVLYFIPVLNLLSPVLLYWFSAWMMAIQYLDYPADNYKVPFKDFLQLMKKEQTLCLTFGLAVSLLASIPLANFLIMPAAVLGATYLWHDRLSQFNVQTKQLLKPSSD